MAAVSVSAAVTDGVTVGHPCCNEYECKEPLTRVSDEFCHLHTTLGAVCCIDGCNTARQSGHRTCGETSHRKAEKDRKERGRRSKRSRNEDSTEATPRVERGRGTGLKGVFGRKWSHNEQLMVRPCGIVIGRATFYESESVTAVKVSERKMGGADAKGAGFL